MKKMRRILAFILALVMCFGMSAVAMATTDDDSNSLPDTVKITVENADRAYEYAAYKIFDAVMTKNGNIAYVASDSYKTDASFYNTFKTYFNEGAPAEAGGFYVTPVENINKEEFVKWLKDNKEKFARTELTEGESTTNTVVFNVLPGYYFIDSALGAVVTADMATTEDIIVRDKNSQNPTAEDDFKKIMVGDEEYVLKDAAIGETVNFKIEFTATSYVTINDENKEVENDSIETKPITTYTIDDTPTGMKFDKDSLKVTVYEPGKKSGDGYSSSSDAVEDGYASCAVDEKGNIKITVNWGSVTDGKYSSNYESGSKVVVEYSAVITDAGLVGDNKDTAENKAKISYDDTELKEDTVTVKTGYFEIAKTDGEQNMLTGAKFELKKGDTEIFFKKNSDGVYVYANPEDTTIEADEKTKTIEVDDTGIAKIKGLGKGTYTLEETEAPAGYNKLNSTITVECDEEGQITYDGKQASNVEISNKKYVDGGLQVENNLGAELPSTGGIGTTIFYVIGGLLVVGAAILLITKKRMSREE